MVRPEVLFLLAASTAMADPQPAIASFNQWCFKAGQTAAQIESNIQSALTEPATFTLTFWDDSLEPRPIDAPKGVERRCSIEFDGDHTTLAIDALRQQMATPPTFGTPIPLPDTHHVGDATALIEGRELLRGRVAVVEVGTRANGTRTFMSVDRLYDGLGLPEKG
ncbi:hypothetical protein [Sulfitobacter aestuariivivens]|uniref:Uncharacterized protein n=1 Tax=Sulfitobacter aestuariivivens TaxID=2766981 RepID=A0A927HF35_9RHOB|nr:hypothetical protein [Sulfitobacter aestuariivivens]MBD3664013.1 hypothetical protein [Sulfitobacter aestuariivivens]